MQSRLTGGLVAREPTQQRIVAVISNMPTGDLTVLDADYVLRLTKTS